MHIKSSGKNESELKMYIKSSGINEPEPKNAVSLIICKKKKSWALECLSSSH